MYLEFGNLLLSHKSLAESKTDEVMLELNNRDENKNDQKMKDAQMNDNDEEKLASDYNNSNKDNGMRRKRNNRNNTSLIKYNTSNNGGVKIGGSDEDLIDPITWFEKLYSAVVESISTADFVTDCLVLKSFITNNHQWWSTWMILSMISPYLVSYSIFGSLFNQKFSIYSEKIKFKAQTKQKCNLLLFGLFAIVLLTPLSLLYFVLIDCFFMLYVAISSIILVLSCTTVDIKHWVDDFIFQKILSMNRMEILGYRRLRTLSQVCCAILLFKFFWYLYLYLH